MNTNPNIFISSTPPKSMFNWKSLLTSKVLLLVLGAALLVGVLLAVNYLRRDEKTIYTPPAEALGEIGGGKIVLVANKNQYRINDNIEVAVRVFTGGHSTEGTDLILKYDPKMIAVSSSAITRGNIYSSYPLAQIDPKGFVRISGISSAGQKGFNGLGTFATIKFKAKQKGQTTLSVDFTPSSTAESNVIASDTKDDILANVRDLDITIADVAKEASSTCASRSLQRCLDEQGHSGSYWCTGLEDPFSCNSGCFSDKDSNTLGCKVESTQ